MNIPQAPGGEVTKSELWEWVGMIAIIISWWPRFFLGWGHPVYLGIIYVVEPLLLVYILIRRWRRMNEGLDYSGKVIDVTRQAQEEAEKAQKKSRRKS